MLMVLLITAAAVVGVVSQARDLDGTPIDITIGDASGRLLVDPGAPSMPLVTTAFAERAGLRAGPFSLRYRVGPIAVNGSSAVGRIDTGSGPARRRIGWTERPFAAGSDGVIGPGGIPDPVVRFVLRPAPPRPAPPRPALAGERIYTLPIDDGGLFGWRAGLFTVLDEAGSPIRIRFDLRHDETIATAGAGLALADAYGGTLAAEVRPQEIAFGIERPTRTMTLRTPVTLGPLSLRTVAVRVSDFGNAEGIAADGAVADPDEIVVTARSNRDRSRDLLTIGRDALARCSSLTFDKPAREIRLSCG